MRRPTYVTRSKRYANFEHLHVRMGAINRRRGHIPRYPIDTVYRRLISSTGMCARLLQVHICVCAEHQVENVSEPMGSVMRAGIV